MFQTKTYDHLIKQKKISLKIVHPSLFFTGEKWPTIIILGMWWRLRIWGISVLFTSFVPFGPSLIEAFACKREKMVNISVWVISSQAFFGVELWQKEFEIHIFQMNFYGDIWNIGSVFSKPDYLFGTFKSFVLSKGETYKSNDILFWIMQLNS